MLLRDNRTTEVRSTSANSLVQVFVVMRQVSVHEAKTHLSRLLRQVILGKDVVITRSGRPVERLVAVEDERPVLASPYARHVSGLATSITRTEIRRASSGESVSRSRSSSTAALFGRGPDSGIWQSSGSLPNQNTR